MLVVAVALLAIGARLIDTPAVRAALQQRLAAALGGEVAWEALELRLLPAPHGELRRVRIDIPGTWSARAEWVDAYLRLWPLFRGRVEIASLSVEEPRVLIAPFAGGATGEPLEPLAAYRRAMAPVARALQRFAPDTGLRIESASIALAQPALELRELNVTARTAHEGLDLELEAASNLWQRLRVQGHMKYADLSARAALQADELLVLPGLPAGRLRAQLHTDAQTAIEGEADIALGTLVQAAKAKLRLPAGGALQASAELSEVDLAQAIALAQRRLPGLELVESAEGRLSGKVDVVLGQDWRLDVQVVKSDAAVKLRPLPWKISPSLAEVSASAKAVEVRRLRGTLGETSYSDVAARLELGKPLRLAAASGRATLRLEQWLPWLRERVPLEEITAASGSLDVTLQRMTLRFDRPAAVDFAALAAPRAVSVALKSLPAPVSVTGGALQAGASQVRLERLAVAMQDARAVVSGTVAVKGPSLELALAEGVVGEKLVQWAMQRADAPARLEPRTPLRVAARRIAWAPGAPLEADAAVEFEGGPRVAGVFAWRPERLELRRLAIKDAQSDATLGAVLGDKQLQASFSGLLQGRTIAAMLRRPLASYSGTAHGDLRVTVDRGRPERTLAEGRLSIEALDLGWLLGKKAVIESAELVAEPSGLRIVKAQAQWEEQSFSLRAQVQRTAQGPVIDARLESPGVVVDKLLPAEKPGEKPAEKNGAKDGAQPGASKLWPLPVTGKIDVRAGFVQYRHHRIAPFEGTLALQRERAQLEVKQARMCGLSFPLAAEAAPDTFTVSARLAMRDEPLEEAMRCLTGGTLEISGTATLQAELRTQGKAREELIRNLSGTAQAELRKGRVKKFALIGNILSLRNIASPEKMQQEGFPYRSMTAGGHFENGGFVLQEGFFDSDAARIAANGRVDLLGADSHLNVLLGLLTTVDRVAGAIPIIGDVFGGSMLALPIGVSGDIRNPLVVPLGPRAVTDRLLGIFERTLKLPGKLVVPPGAGEGAPPSGAAPPPAGEAPPR